MTEVQAAAQADPASRAAVAPRARDPVVRVVLARPAPSAAQRATQVMAGVALPVRMEQEARSPRRPAGASTGPASGPLGPARPRVSLALPEKAAAGEVPVAGSPAPRFRATPEVVAAAEAEAEGR